MEAYVAAVVWLARHCHRSPDRIHKTMTLAVREFVRRFALHLLPQRRAKIRHYGLLANRGRQARVAQVLSS